MTSYKASHVGHGTTWCATWCANVGYSLRSKWLEDQSPRKQHSSIDADTDGWSDSTRTPRAAGQLWDNSCVTTCFQASLAYAYE